MVIVDNTGDARRAAQRLNERPGRDRVADVPARFRLEMAVVRHSDEHDDARHVGDANLTRLVFHFRQQHGIGSETAFQFQSRLVRILVLGQRDIVGRRGPLPVGQAVPAVARQERIRPNRCQSANRIGRRLVGTPVRSPRELRLRLQRQRQASQDAVSQRKHHHRIGDDRRSSQGRGDRHGAFRIRLEGTARRVDLHATNRELLAVAGTGDLVGRLAVGSGQQHWRRAGAVVQRRVKAFVDLVPFASVELGVTRRVEREQAAALVQRQQHRRPLGPGRPQHKRFAPADETELSLP